MADGEPVVGVVLMLAVWFYERSSVSPTKISFTVAVTPEWMLVVVGDHKSVCGKD